MSISYTYPRVDVVTTALQRQTYNETIDDTLVMFAPFKSSMGPMDEIKRIHSLGEFEATYGTTNYSVMGHTGLNIRNWLNNGGTVYAMRHDVAGSVASTKAYGTIMGGRYAFNIDMMGLISEIKKLNITDDAKKAARDAFIQELPYDTKLNINFVISNTTPISSHIRIGGSGKQIVLSTSSTSTTGGITYVGDYGNKNVVYSLSGATTNFVDSIDVGTLSAELNIAAIKNALTGNSFISIIDLNTKKVYSGSDISDDIIRKTLNVKTINNKPDSVNVEDMNAPNEDKTKFEAATFYNGIEYGTSELGQYRYYLGVRCPAIKTGGTTISDYSKMRIYSKNVGSGYNNLTVSGKVRRVDSNRNPIEYTLSVYLGASIVERINLTENNWSELFDRDNSLSEYIYFDFKTDSYSVPADKASETMHTLLDAIVYSTSTSGGKLTFSKGVDSSAADNDVVKDVFETTDSGILNQLRNTLEYPIDFVIDAAYSIEVKTAIYKAFCSEATDPNFLRNDINVLLDAFSIETDGTYDDHQTEVDSLIDTNNTRNLSVYSQLVRTHNPFNPTEVIAVAPSYYLTQLIPNNAIQQQRGTHEPIAGLNRGVLTDVVSVNESPLPEKKEEYFQNRTNYIETDRYRSAFMSQRTREKREDNTALQFLNNSITTNRMVKELSKLARVYLFEYNDAVTLSNLRSVLNKYISEFVANRTLSYAMVDVQKNPYSEEAIDVTLNIKFTGTIEVISVALTIE